MLSNPIFICGAIALGIVLLLVTVVIICCKKSSKREREELRELSEKIESGTIIDEITDEDDAKIERVLSKMQESIELKQEPIEVEQEPIEVEQEENVIISYEELLKSLENKNVDSIEVFEEEPNQIEISDFNKEIIEAYQKENLDKEIYHFQNDFSSEEMPLEFNTEQTPVMNFQQIDMNEIETNEIEDELKLEENIIEEKPVYEAKHAISNHKFKSSDIISPVYGVVNENKQIKKDNFDEIEEIILEDDSF